MNYPTAREICSRTADVPPGVEFRELKVIADDRGEIMELCRDSWAPAGAPVQWIVSHSHANVLRGVHVHKVHTDFLIVSAGEVLLGLQDVRPVRSGVPRALIVRLASTDPHLVIVPPGVAHAFYFEAPGSHILGTTTEWDGRDDYACHWQDRELRLDWPCRKPRLSSRDSQAGSFAEMIAAIGF